MKNLMIFGMGIVLSMAGSTVVAAGEINPDHTPIVHTTSVRTVTTPITHQKYFRGERDLFGYRPRFTPGPVNFDLNNIPYIRVGVSPQGRDMYGEFTSLGIIQTLDANGQWINLTSWLDAIKAVYPAWNGIYSAGTYNDEQIIFDGAGDAYMIVNGWYLPQSRGLGCLVLLYSRDKCRTWQVYPLSTSIFYAKLEMPEAWNDTGNPPVLLGSPYGFTGGPLYLIAPTKTAGGKLSIPATVTLAPASDNAAGAPLHSGMGNSTITKGNLVHTVYLRNARSPDNTTGTPQYIVTYDRVSKKVIGPVFLGTSDNSEPDIHDGPAITIDRQGYLHVILGAHGGRFQYTRSRVPNSITGGWTAPVFIGVTGDPNPGWTYVSLLCDKNDILHVIGRYSGYCYYFGLWYLRKESGQSWESRGPLVMPFRNYYSCWHHKLTMDRRGRLFVSYMYYGSQYDRGRTDNTTPEMDAYRARWPWEKPVLVDPVNTYYDNLSAHEPCLLVSDDGGDSWRLGLTTALQVFFNDTFDNGLDGWKLTNGTSSSPIAAVGSYTCNGKTITPRTGTTFARCEAASTGKKAVHQIDPAQSGIFTGYLNMVENTGLGMIQITGGGHSFSILANSAPGRVSYRIDSTQTATSIPVTTQAWHQVRFTVSTSGVDGYWDRTRLFHSPLATSVSAIVFGSEAGSAPCGYDDFSFVPQVSTGRSGNSPSKLVH